MLVRVVVCPKLKHMLFSEKKKKTSSECHRNLPKHVLNKFLCHYQSVAFQDMDYEATLAARYQGLFETQ